MKNKPSIGPKGGVIFAALLPHAPILVPAVAGANLAECHTTVDAMGAVARRLVEARPAAVVVISPHAPRAGRACRITGDPVTGSLARFRAPQAAMELPGAAPLAQAIVAAATARALATAELPSSQLDHGSVVPLWHLAQAGWRGPTLVVALAEEDNARVGELGEAVAVAAVQIAQRVAVVASGDMSHCLKPGAPAGYDPQAARFDAVFIEQLRSGATRELRAAVSTLQGCAAEDCVDSTQFALGAAGWRAAGREVVSYEGPFGVGYGVAVLFDSAARPRPDLPALARAAIVAALTPGRGASGTPSAGDCPGGNGVFVTLHGVDGRLRGCIGTMVSQTGDLAVETWRMAREAALHDPRFSPVRADELARLRIEVTMLEPLEEIESPESLDPQHWGVVVRAGDGRRGVLLPAIPEVTSVAQQLEIARAKAGIGPDEPVRLQRFAARRLEEAARG